MWHFIVCVCCVCVFFFSSFCAFPAHHCVVWAKKPPVDQRQSSPSVQSHSNRKSEEMEWKKKKTIWEKNHHSHNLTMLIFIQFITLWQCAHFCVHAYEYKESLEEQTIVPLVRKIVSLMQVVMHYVSIEWIGNMNLIFQRRFLVLCHHTV